MTYARARLWSGITGVGLYVVLAVMALAFDLPARLARGEGLAAAVGSFALFALLYVLVGFPLDLVAGRVIPRRFRRPTPGAAEFLASWSRGALAHAGFLVLAATLLLAVGRAVGLAGALAALLGLMLVMLWAQEGLARLVGNLRATEADLSPVRQRLAEWGLELPATTVVKNREPSFVGGLVGGWGRTRVVLPATWLNALSSDELAAQIARRAAVSGGGRQAGVAGAIAWNLGGFAACSFLPGAGVTSGAGMIALALWFTLWSFIGLLVLPSLSRSGVFAADRAALDRGVPRELLERTLRRLDALQEDEPARPQGVETVFHPVPSLSRRLQALDEELPHAPRWHLARTAIYLGWASFSLLSRAVHCNNGRPELWVLLPGD